MANRIIPTAVSNETIKPASKNAGAAGSDRAVSLAITFDSTWDSTPSKIVQFLDAYGQNPTNITLTSGMLVNGAYVVPITSEPLKYAGEMTVTIRGVEFEVDGTTVKRVIMSASTIMNVQNSLYNPNGAAPVEPTPTQAEQLLASVNSVTGMTVSATNLATGAPATVTKTNNVDGTINLAYGLPAGGKGDTGNTGNTGATGAKGDTGNPGAVYQASEPTGVVLWIDSDDDEPSTITKANIGLGNVDNTADLGKPISTATQTALTEVTTSISELQGFGKTPITTYAHTTNKEVAVTAVDISTGIFTSAAHGLVNGNGVCTFLNTANKNDILLKYMPTGFTATSYFVVNATTDTFQLSLTSGGAAIMYTTNANQDLTKWHFEVATNGTIGIVGLPAISKCKIVVRGRSINVAYGYCTPYNTSTTEYRTATYFSNSVSTINQYPQLLISGQTWFSSEIYIDVTNGITIKSKTFRINPSTVSANANVISENQFVDIVTSVSTFTKIAFTSFYPANGTIVEVYRA